MVGLHSRSVDTVDTFPVSTVPIIFACLLCVLYLVSTT